MTIEQIIGLVIMAVSLLILWTIRQHLLETQAERDMREWSDTIATQRVDSDMNKNLLIYPIVIGSLLAAGFVSLDAGAQGDPSPIGPPYIDMTICIEVGNCVQVERIPIPTTTTDPPPVTDPPTSLAPGTYVVPGAPSTTVPAPTSTEPPSTTTVPPTTTQPTTTTSTQPATTTSTLGLEDVCFPVDGGLPYPCVDPGSVEPPTYPTVNPL